MVGSRESVRFSQYSRESLIELVEALGRVGITDGCRKENSHMYASIRGTGRLSPPSAPEKKPQTQWSGTDE